MRNQKFVYIYILLLCISILKVIDRVRPLIYVRNNEYPIRRVEFTYIYIKCLYGAFGSRSQALLA